MDGVATQAGVEIAVEPNVWEGCQSMTTRKFARELQRVPKNVKLVLPVGVRLLLAVTGERHA